MLLKRTNIFILIGVFFILICCSSYKISYYKEIQPAWFDLRNPSFWNKNEWISKTENLIVIHETFKKVGYEKIMNLDHLDSLYFEQNLYKANPLLFERLLFTDNKSPWTLLDSLEITRGLNEISDEGFAYFWLNSILTKNDSISLAIISDINKVLKKRERLNVNERFVNDTLYRLMKIDYVDEPITKESALENFTTFRDLGFHYSAYKMMEYDSRYKHINWNKDSLKNTLQAVDQYSPAWYLDDGP